MNSEPVAPERLAEKIAERLKFESQKVVFFKIDDDAPYGDVVNFMDIVRGAGAEDPGHRHQGLTAGRPGAAIWREL